MRHDPGVVLCHGRTRFIDLRGNPLGLYDGDFDAPSDDPLEYDRTVRERPHLGIPVQAGVIRLDALRRCGCIGNYRDCDRVLIAGLALAGKFVLLPEVLFFRRWHSSVALALRSPLDVERIDRPDATRAPQLLSFPRHIGQLPTAVAVPDTLAGKGRALAAAIRCTDWRRKLGRSDPAPASDHDAGD